MDDIQKIMNGIIAAVHDEHMSPRHFQKRCFDAKSSLIEELLAGKVNAEDFARWIVEIDNSIAEQKKLCDMRMEVKKNTVSAYMQYRDSEKKAAVEKIRRITKVLSDAFSVFKTNPNAAVGKWPFREICNTAIQDLNIAVHDAYHSNLISDEERRYFLNQGNQIIRHDGGFDHDSE